jgi:reactive intermediate/imine deaminase
MSSPIKGSASALGVYISGEIKPLCNRDIGSNEFFIDQTQDALDAEELKAQGKLLRIVSGDRSGSGCFTVEEYIDSDVYIPVVSADAKPEAKNIPELSDDIDKKISDCVKQLLDLATQKSEASQTSSDLESKRQQVSTKDAPQAFGPYSQAIKANGFVFISGCLGMDPVTMKLKGDTVETQTIQALENLKAILAASDCSLENVCKTTILLRDMSSYAVVNKLYATYFSGKAPPARTTFAVLELPAQALVEIDAIAVL